jgi:hypothetical protein
VKGHDRLDYKAFGENGIVGLERVDDAAVPFDTFNPLASLCAHGVEDDECEQGNNDSAESLQEEAVAGHLRHQHMEAQVAFVECVDVLAFGRGTHVGQRLLQLAEVDFFLRYYARAIALENSTKFVTVTDILLGKVGSRGRCGPSPSGRSPLR